MRPFLVLAAALTLLASSIWAQPPASAQTCDRACLKGMIDKYLAALVKHDPSALPTAANVRFTEDADVTKLGEGHWKTIESLGDFRQDILDVKGSTAGVHVLALEAGKPVLIATRLKVAAGKVSEIESMVVRNQAEGMIFNTGNIKEASAAMNVTPTAAQRTSREAMIEMALRYPGGLKIGSFVKSDAQFAATAYRFENGQLMAGPGCTFIPGCDNIREQGLPTLAGIVAKIAAVDEEQGIVWVRMNFGPGSVMGGGGPGRGAKGKAPAVPAAAPAAPPDVLDVFEMFKIYDGKIQAVEAFMQKIPQGKSDGWTN